MGLLGVELTGLSGLAVSIGIILAVLGILTLSGTLALAIYLGVCLLVVGVLYYILIRLDRRFKGKGHGGR